MAARAYSPIEGPEQFLPPDDDLTARELIAERDTT
jgi:hypothetical protein